MDTYSMLCRIAVRQRQEACEEVESERKERKVQPSGTGRCQGVPFGAEGQEAETDQAAAKRWQGPSIWTLGDVGAATWAGALMLKHWLHHYHWKLQFRCFTLVQRPGLL